METNKKNILIVGCSAKEYSLAKKLSEYENVEKVFVAPGNSLISEVAQCVDIREDMASELLEFVMEHAVDLTIVTSTLAIKSDVVSLFNANSQMIFAPSAQSAAITVSKGYAKKFLYKQRIPTPRFGIFEKSQLALDYLKTANYPLIIKCDEDQEGQDRLACTNYSLASIFVDELFMRGEKKVVIEDYVYGHDFTFYLLTDGYQVLPIVSVADYKFTSDGDGGLFTEGVGAYAPDYRISSELETRILKDVAQRVISGLARNNTPYTGILGIELVLKADGNYVVTGFKPFLQDHDSDIVLDLIDENLVVLFEACVIGSFADDYEFIKLKNNSAVSCVISSPNTGEKIIRGLDLLDEDSKFTFINAKKNEYLEYLTLGGRTLVLTRSASTLSRARNLLYEDVNCIDFCGKKFRSDICPPVK